jgi:C1A family cysteine protease
LRRQLEALDIVRADQLVALARRPDIREELARHLGTTEAAVSAAETAAATGATAAIVRAPAVSPSHALGALKPPPSFRAMALSLPLASSARAVPKLPKSVNLVAKMPPIRFQGSRGTCVAFCLTAIHEYRDRRRRPDYSERHLYYEAKSVDGHPAACGTTQAAAADELASKGQCTEHTWAYNPTATCNDHGGVPAGATAEATRHTIALTALNPQDVVAIKTALASGRPAGISIPVFNSWYESPATERTGRITLPIGGEKEAGGHCMCVVGYQDDTRATVTPTPGGGFFILRNSWSTSWGANCAFGAGYGTIPYAYIAGHNWECYTLPEGAKPKRKTARRKAVKRKAAKKTRTRARRR